MPSIHPCLVPALVFPRPCHACYIVHSHRTIGPGLHPAQYAPRSRPYAHVLAACQSKMAACTQHTHIVHVCCASTSHVMSWYSSMCPVFPFRPSWYIRIPSLHGAKTDMLRTGHHIYDDPALQPEPHTGGCAAPVVTPQPAEPHHACATTARCARHAPCTLG